MALDAAPEHDLDAVIVPTPACRPQSAAKSRASSYTHLIGSDA
jgi:hypothetical protein